MIFFQKTDRRGIFRCLADFLNGITEYRKRSADECSSSRPTEFGICGNFLRVEVIVIEKNVPIRRIDPDKFRKGIGKGSDRVADASGL